MIIYCFSSVLWSSSSYDHFCTDVETMLFYLQTQAGRLWCREVIHHFVRLWPQRPDQTCSSAPAGWTTCVISFCASNISVDAWTTQWSHSTECWSELWISEKWPNSRKNLQIWTIQLLPGWKNLSRATLLFLFRLILSNYYDVSHLTQWTPQIWPGSAPDLWGWCPSVVNPPKHQVWC